MLTIESLQQKILQGEQFDYIFFWGHTPSENGKVNKSCLSQWYESPFVIGEIKYLTAEHWMMASKARLFKDEKSLDEILQAKDPKTAKVLGRRVQGFDEQIWKENARRLVTEGNLAKFGQHKELKEFLISTGNAVLVEASPYDKIWGIGLSADDPKTKNPFDWQGQNLLGFALVDVRSDLIKTVL